MKVVIEKGTTAVYVYCNNDGRFVEAPSLSVHPFLKQNLIEYEWDFRRKKSFPRYHYYKFDRKTGRLHMPVNILSYLETYLRSGSIGYEVLVLPPNESIEIEMISTGDFDDREYQNDAINFLTQEPGMRALELQTGLGKTFIAVRALMKIKKRALISVPAFLLNQWNDALIAICETKVDVIRGNKSIRELIDAAYQTDTAVFLASVNTLQEYAIGTGLYDVFPPFRDFIKGMMFGAKIVDECHLNFNANMMIDIQSDIEYNLYLSATYMRGNSNSNRIFRKIFPDEIKFNGLDYNRYVNITECRYDLGEIAERAVMTERGYSQFKYEKFLLRSGKKLHELLGRVLYPVVEHYFIQKKRDGQKLLILVGLRETAELFAAWFKDTYPNLVSTEYLQDTDDAVLAASDVIISTFGSAGTGKDIKGLRTMIMFVSFSSEARTMQAPGRLRKMEDTPEFIYLVNTKVKSHRSHADFRGKIYRHIAKQFRIVEI